MQLHDSANAGSAVLGGAAGDRYVSVTEAATFLGVSVSWLNRLRTAGGGPAYSKLSQRGRVTYRIADLVEWAEARRRTSTAQVEAA